MTKTNSVRNREDLRHYQEILRLRLARHEEELDQSWKHLKANYKGMIWKEVNPFKGNEMLNTALDLIQPGVLPVISEVAKGSLKGKPVNRKVITSSIKYAAASLGIKWLRKWLETKPEDQEDLNQGAYGKSTEDTKE